MRGLKPSIALIGSLPQSRWGSEGAPIMRGLKLLCHWHGSSPAHLWLRRCPDHEGIETRRG